jgi:hypothetical protein
MRTSQRSAATLVVAACAVPSICSAGDDPPVQVIVDMDTSTPGIQTTVSVPACTNTVGDIGVYVIDPLGTRVVWSIGYIGAINRGIAFGHVPGDANAGEVTGITPATGTPVNPANVAEVLPDAWVDPAFDGIEVQYVECCGNAPVVLSAAPDGPIFTVQVDLDGTQPGDQFAFHVADFVSIWRATWIPDVPAGVFSTLGDDLDLDTGGDSVPDRTPTVLGPDGDEAVPMPPAAFLVDYVDGPAMITIVPAPGDVDGSGAIDVADLTQVILQWGPCRDCDADLDDDGTVDVDDLVTVLLAWGGC